MAAWRMAFRGGPGGEEMWPWCQKFGVAAIGYAPLDDIDLAGYAVGQLPPEWSQLMPSQKASLRRFVYEMSDGDVIYAKQGPNIVGKGVVVGPYEFDTKNRIRESNGEYWQHQRPVDWLQEFPAVHLQLGEQQMVTVAPLTAEHVQKFDEPTGRSWLNASASADVADRNAGSEYVAPAGDYRRMVWRQICDRRGQQKFRDILRQRYGDRCFVTGCTVLDVLEAAHIDPYRGDDNDHPDNGLLLRADIHTLFDLHLLGINPETMRVELHPSVSEYYKNLEESMLCGATINRPSSHALQRRYARFQHRIACAER